MLEASNLQIKFDDRIVLDKINIKIAQGQLMVIKGKNGSGKTSLLKLLAGIMSDDSESSIIQCAGHNIKDHIKDYFYTRSYVDAHYQFNEQMNLSYYLDFWAKLNSHSEGIEFIKDNVIKYFQFEEFVDLRFAVSKLSSGWKKRLHYSRLMFENRAIWLLDEPFTFLDISGRDKIVNLINSKIMSGGIVILTSNEHDIDALLQNAIVLNLDQ